MELLVLVLAPLAVLDCVPEREANCEGLQLGVIEPVEETSALDETAALGVMLPDVGLADCDMLPDGLADSDLLSSCDWLGDRVALAEPICNAESIPLELCDSLCDDVVLGDEVALGDTVYDTESITLAL